jgi:hypothetical protein
MQVKRTGIGDISVNVRHLWPGYRVWMPASGGVGQASIRGSFRAWRAAFEANSFSAASIHGVLPQDQEIDERNSHQNSLGVQATGFPLGVVLEPGTDLAPMPDHDWHQKLRKLLVQPEVDEVVHLMKVRRGPPGGWRRGGGRTGSLIKGLSVSDGTRSSESG